MINMVCGCTDRLNTNKSIYNNTQSNNKTLCLDSMQKLSTDEIINLYRQGYTLEERSINSLTYATECSGSPTVDKSNSTSGFNLGLGIPHIIAQKFTPTSMCLQSVTIRAKQVYSNQVRLRVYITPDASGLPNSNWEGSSLGWAEKWNNEVPIIYTDLNFVLNIKLNNLNPLWIVVVPGIYDPNGTDNGLDYIDLEEGDVSGSVTALKVGTGNWSLRDADSLVYSTHKTTYASSQLLTSISPANPSIQKNSTQQFTALDHSGNPITTGVAWAKTSGVGSIDPTTGLYSAGATAGPASISATYADVTKTTSLTVSITLPAAEGSGSGMLIGLVGVMALGIMMTSKNPSPHGQVGVGKAPIE